MKKKHTLHYTESVQRGTGGVLESSTDNNLEIIQTLRNIQNVLRQSHPPDWVEALRIGGTLFPSLAMSWQRLDGAAHWQNVAMTSSGSMSPEAKNWTEGPWRLLAETRADVFAETWAGLLFDCLNQHARLVTAREELYSSRADYETLRSAGFEGIVIHREGHLLEMNDAFLRLYGYSREEMLGMHMSQTISAETLSRVSALVSEGFEGVYETNALRKDGTTIQLEAQATNCMFRGKPARVAAFRDIRGLKAIAIALEKAKQTAENANQLKTQFLGDISHELRTPLNAIMGAAELLRNTTLETDQRRLLDVVQDNAQDLMELLNDLLDFTRIEEDRLELRIEPFDLSQMLHNAIRSMRQLRAGVALRLDFDPSLARSWVGDERRIRQVVLNLLDNAAKFTEQGQICLRAMRCESKIHISVSDTGLGISDDLQKILFRRFAQGEASKAVLGGIGLGLHISHRLASKMGGALRVSSVHGEGSTFTLELGLSPAQQTVELSPANPSLPTPPSPMNVLLAEDTPVNQFVLRRMIEAMGHRVEVVANGEQALLAVEKRSFDVVLMDVQMPHMDGLEATRGVRGRGLDVPIYALTANALEPNFQTCMDAGMNGFLTKPVSQKQLHEVFARLGSVTRLAAF